MIKTNSDGFKIFHNGAWGDFLVWDSSRASACLTYLKRNSELGIHVNPFLSFHESDLSFLKQCPNVRGLIVLGNVRWSGLEHAVLLETLGLDENSQDSIDLSRLSHLTRCAITWSKRVSGLPVSTGLKELVLTGCKPVAKNLTELKALVQLIQLALIKPNISSLQGIESCVTLNGLEITTAPNLGSIAHLMRLAGSLTELTLDGCKSIKDIDLIGGMGSLRKLKLLQCGRIESLSFLSTLKALEIFSFVGTEIVDGKLDLLRQVKHVGFEDRGHYSHTLKQLSES